MTNSKDEMSHFVSSMSYNIVEECPKAMLHNDMDQSRLMLLSQQIDMNRIRREIEMQRGKDPMMDVLIRVRLKSKTNQSLLTDPPTISL